MLKIMIVDDDYVISEELKEVLLGLEYDVVGVVSSGEAAVETAPGLKPDVILMDIVMPGGMDGTEAAEIIMGLLDCAVVFVTGYGDDEIVERAKNVAPHGYLLKPFEPAEVKASIEIAFHKKQIEDQLKKAYGEALAELEERTSELEASNRKLKALLNAPTDSMALLDLDGAVLAANPITAKRYGTKLDEFVGKCVYDLMPKKLAKSRKAKLDRVVKTKKPSQFTDKRGGGVFDNSIYPIFDNTGKVIQAAFYGKDITREVESLNRLEEGKKELESKTTLLEDANMALKIMLQKSTENRKEIEEEVLSTLKKMVAPYISKIKKAEINPDVREYINTLEANLRHVASPFSRNLSFEYITLTPKEIQVANLVRDGKVTREIAEALNMKNGTVEFYRNNIREKIGIRGKKIRLRSHLLTLRNSK